MFTPYFYQDGCLIVLRTIRVQGKIVALIVMASGLGKTVTVAFDAKEWLKENKGRILYLCHQNDILGQAQQTFASILGEGYSYGFFTGTEKTAHKVDCLFASFQTMSKNVQRMFSPTEFGYIIVDESHHSQAPSHLKIVEYFKPKFLLGATATPDRADGLNIRSVFGEEVFNLPLEKALAEGLLTKVDYRLVTDEISLDQIDLKTVDEFLFRDIDRTIFVPPKRDEEIAASIDRHASELAEQRIVVFTNSIAHAEALARSISGSVAIHSELPPKEKQVRIEMFRQGMIRAVITVDCFNEGLDIPEANLLVFLRSTTSMRIFYQQLGRGLRLCQGKDKVIVLDFIGNAERITMLKELADAIGLHYTEAMAARASKGSSPFRIKFDEKAQGVLDLVKRTRPKRISDMPDLSAEYSPRNPLSASHISAKSWKEVWWSCGKCAHEWQTSAAARSYGRQCPKCEGQVTAKNNLSSLYPGLAKQYAAKNPLPADKIKAISKEISWWNCPKCSYEYATSPYSRIYRHDGCPACAAQIPAYKDNMAFNSPKLTLDYGDTNMLSPEHVSMRSTFGRWWVCFECGHSYLASARGRDDGKGCPRCAAKAPTKTVNLMITHPFLAEEYSSRNRKPADTILADTDEQLWWVCSSCGRYWQASGRERLDGKRCSHCPKIAAVAVV